MSQFYEQPSSFGDERLQKAPPAFGPNIETNVTRVQRKTDQSRLTASRQIRGERLRVKSKRHPNHRLVKIHRNYTVEEIADLFGIHKNTVRLWVKTGLRAFDTKRPMLILGCDLARFLQARRASKKQTCGPGELYCVKCRAPKPPAGDMADYEPVTDKIGNLIGICPDCDCIINRRVSMAKLAQSRGILDISFPQAQRRVSESNQPSVNSELKGGTKDDTTQCG